LPCRPRACECALRWHCGLVRRLIAHTLLAHTAAFNKRMRLHFNKIGYKMYGKKQSRRVPSHNAKPGNPGYGFRRARWRDMLNNEQDRIHCEMMLKSISCDDEQIERVKKVVQEYQQKWEIVRRPTRPAGPGRPRRAPCMNEDSDVKLSDHEEADLPPASPDASGVASGKKRPADAMAAGTSQSAPGHNLWQSLAEIAGSKLECARSEVSSKQLSAPSLRSSAFPLYLGAYPLLQPHGNTCVRTGGPEGYACGGQAGWPFAVSAAAGLGASLMQAEGQSGESSLTLPPLRLQMT
jgi:hypothetical protein